MIIFFIYLLIFFIFFLLIKQLNHQIVCNNIYNQKDIYTKQYVIKNFISPQTCDEIINESEEYSKLHGWSKDRHDDYPTTDNEITKKWSFYQFLTEKIKKELYPYYESFYKIDSSKLKIDDLFAVKYDGDNKNSQKLLKEHEDGSEFSFIIALNDDYSGGGTRFVKNNKIIKLKKGDIVIFSGQTTHEGLKVTKGLRYILTGFLHYGFCFQRFDDYF